MSAAIISLHANRRAMAQRHVMTGRRIVARQRRLVLATLARGHDAAASQHLLETFLVTQAILEDDLAAILRTRV